MVSQHIARASSVIRNESIPLEREAANLEGQILALQWAQLRHDQTYHRDIAVLPVAERMKHFALHMAKYVGHIAEAAESGDDKLLLRTLVDAFIIGIAAANTLQLDLGRVLAGRWESAPNDLRSLGIHVARELHRSAADIVWLLRKVGQYTGCLAKACESLDHIEEYPFRSTMQDSICRLFEVIVAEASLRNLDLSEKAALRLASIERTHLFYGRHECD